MAIYHLSTQAISRGQGRSVVACAAYRAAEQLHDERQDKTHDYRRKDDVAHAEIMLPENAPSFLSDRETLWNHVEAIEKRKDARLAREVQFSLPRELTTPQNIELAREFVQKTFVDKGMVADIAVHVDKASDGECQPHAHVLLTTREVTQDGFGLKNREWNKADMLMEWREAWANAANRHLALHGHDIQIDHRSYADQGIELEPQHKIGSIEVRERLARLADHQRIARENGERIYQEPNIALDALTRQQSTFTHQDLARFINRHTEDSDQFQQVYDKVQASPELVRLGVDGKGRERLTTRTMLDIESNLLRTAKDLSERGGHKINPDALERAIERRTLSDEQITALKYLTDTGDLKCLVGYAGTGKSYLLGAAREVWEESGYRVQGIALSGIAAQNLEQGSGIQSRTVASFLARLDRGIDSLSSHDIVIIDEAGMLGSRQTERIMREVEASHAKAIPSGDGQQLQAIEAGGAFRAMIETAGFIELTDIRRQQIPWQREATLELAKGQVDNALERYRTHDHIHTFETQGEAKARLIDQWNDARHTNPEETQLIMAYTRKDVKELNDMARSLMKRDGELGQEYKFDLERGERHLAVNDRVYFLKRDDSLRVVNGTLGTVKAIDDKTGRIQVELDRDDLNPRDRLITVDTKQYKHLDHGYAATVYKAKGVTVDRSYMLTSKHYDAHSTYVGLSRHRQSCDVFVSRDEFSHERELTTTLGRDRTKDITLDYTQPEREFARQRAIQSVTPAAQSEIKPEQILKRQALNVAAHLRPEQEGINQSLQAFREEFKRNNPELAKRIEDNIRPQHEKRALAFEQQFKQYTQDLQQGRLTARDKAQFEKQTADLAKEPQVMAYLKHKNPALALKVENMAKDHERHVQRFRERGLDLSR